MRVDYQGLLKQSRDSLTREEPALAEMLRQFESHITQLGRRWYAGDTSAVDEFLQLYCVEHDARTQLLKQAGAHATAEAVECPSCAGDGGITEPGHPNGAVLVCPQCDGDGSIQPAQPVTPPDSEEVDQVGSASNLDVPSCWWINHGLYGQITQRPEEADAAAAEGKVVVEYALRFGSPAASPEPIELLGVAEALAEGDGFWRSCTGCHETNEGVPTGPYSEPLKCHLGSGCGECGGIGAIWDTTDYSAMGDK